MRQIKFKGKRKDNGEWVFGDYCSLPNSNIVFINANNEIDCEMIDPDTVSQFTGLTDKNGKEIYEGDIIKEKESNYSNEYRLYRVYWCDDNMQYLMSDDDSGDSFPLIELEIDYSVVIGSIHDNPELINEKQ